MTTHDDLTDRTDIETRLRATLRDRAEDVDTTPALYERVQRQASRGAWLRRGLALAGAAAVVVAVFTVVPALLPEPEIDIAETPEDAAPTDDDTDAPLPADGTPPSLDEALADAGLAYARDASSGGSSVHAAGRVVSSPVRVVSLAASPVASGERDVAAGREDGTIGVVDSDDTGDQFDLVVDASANGSGVTFSPAGDAIAWIQGTELHVLPASDSAERRVLPLEGDVPDDLRIEQWFSQADAQIIIASDPDGGMWRIPMDDSNSFNSAPTDPASPLPGAEGANDALLLPDLQLVTVLPATDGGLSMTIGGELRPVPASSSRSRQVELSGPAGQMITMHDPSIGWGVVQSVNEGAAGGVVVTSWEDPSIVAVVPTLPLDQTGAGTLDIPPPTDDTTAEDATAGDTTGEEMSAPGDAAALGLPTDAPVIGTSGRFLVAVTPPDQGPVSESDTISLEVYPAESEATFGRLAVRPGSTLDDGLVAVESSSEGETSVRFVALRDGEASPVGEVLVTAGPITGLVWTEDGGTVVWSDTAGIHAAGVAGEGDVAGLAGERISEDTRPVLDAVWTSIERDGDFVVTASGHLTVGVNGVTGVELLGLEREGDTILRVTGTAGGSDRLELDTHANPGAAVGPSVSAAVGGGTAVLRWYADGDRFGDLPDPGLLGGDVRVQVSGGHVLAMGDSRQVLVTFDGEVIDLPTASDWDVLD